MNNFINKLVKVLTNVDITTLQKELSDYKAANSEAKRTLASKDSAISQLRAIIVSKEALIDSKKNSLNEVQKTVASKDEELKKERDLHLETIKRSVDLKSKLTKALSEVRKKNMAIKSLEEDLQSKENEIADLNKQISDFHYINNDNKAKIEDLQDQNHELSTANEELKSQVYNLTNEVDDTKKRLDNSEKRLLDTKQELAEATQRLSSLSDYEDRIDVLTVEINSKERDIRELQNERVRLNGEIESYKDRIKALQSEIENLKEKIHELKNTISQKEKQIESNYDESLIYKKEIEDLKKTIESLNKELAELKTQISTNIPATPPQQTPPDKPTIGHILPEEPPTELPGNGVINNPEVPKDTLAPPKGGGIGSGECINPTVGGVKERRIDVVIDIEEEGEKRRIIADEFFARPEHEIMAMRRVLNSAIIANQPKLVCEYCGQMIKIVGRNNGKNTSYFFSHLKNSDDCAIKSFSGLYETYYRARQYGLLAESPRHRDIKQFIYNILNTEQSRNQGIKDVAMDKTIIEKHPLFAWRRPDVCATFDDRKLVFELQLSNSYLDVINQRDIFYRQNKHFIIWVSNLDDEMGYEALNYANFKDVYYNNKRNIFILDQEAIEKSKELGKLVLKCNWLTPDNKWKYPIHKHHAEGLLVSLSELKYDSDTYKPYYYDAEKEYFSVHQDQLAKQVEMENKLKHMLDLMNKGKKSAAEESLDQFDELRKKVGFDTILTTMNNILIVKKDIYCGVIDLDGNILIPFKYNDLRLFDDNSNLFIAQTGTKLGVIDINDFDIQPFIYRSIEKLKNGKAKVEDKYGWVGCLNDKGEAMPSIESNLKNGFQIIRLHLSYGLRQSNLDILPIEYDNIEPLNNTSILNCKKDDRYGFFSIETSKEIPAIYGSLFLLNSKVISGKTSDNTTLYDASDFTVIIDNISKAYKTQDDNIVIIYVDNLYYLYDIQSRNKITDGYVKINSQTDGTFVVKSIDGNKYNLDNNGQPVTDILLNEEEFKKICQSGKVGLVCREAHYTILPVFSEIGSYRKNICAITDKEAILYDIKCGINIPVKVKLLNRTKGKVIGSVNGKTVLMNKNQIKKSNKAGYTVKLGEYVDGYITHVSPDGLLVYFTLVPINNTLRNRFNKGNLGDTFTAKVITTDDTFVYVRKEDGEAIKNVTKSELSEFVSSEDIQHGDIITFENKELTSSNTGEFMIKPIAYQK